MEPITTEDMESVTAEEVEDPLDQMAESGGRGHG